MSTLSFVEKIASKPRFAGTAGEQDAYTLISDEFENLGCEVEREETEYIKSERYLTFWGLTILWLTLLLLASPRLIHPLLVCAGIIVLFAFQTIIYPRIELRFARSKSTNIIATVNPEKDHRLIICGHYDSARVMSKFAQRNQKTLMNIAPFISLVIMLYVVLLFVRGLQLLATDGFNIYTSDGMTGVWEFIWLFYVVLLGVIAIPATYILLAHLTNKISHGADDNASGIAVMLEAARRLKDDNLNLRIDFACFAAEERGLFGSRKWVNKHIKEFDKDRTYVLNLDCVGRGKKFFINKGLGIIRKKKADPMLFNIVCSACSELHYPYQEAWGGSSDHAEFLRKKLKCCAIMRCDEIKANVAHKTLRRIFRIPIRSDVISFMDWIHTETDVSDRMDETRLEETTQLTIRFVEKLDQQVTAAA